jgi:hypothetical protein
MLIFLICLILVALFWRLLLPWALGLAGIAAILTVVLCIWLHADAHDPQKLARYAQDEAKLAADEQMDWLKSDHRSEWEKNMGYK